MENDNVTILIIDDKEANIYALEKLLEKPNRIFLRAFTGKAGLQTALENPVDLIFLDVQMPEMDGFEVAQILKSNNRTKDIPIIFASAEKKERSTIMKAFEEGAVDYLSKPLDPELTKAKVNVLLKIQLQKKELIEKNLSLEKADARIKQLNSDLTKHLEELEALNKEMESFSYSVSHDLRAPLRSLDGYSRILTEDYASKLDEEGKRIVDVIQQNAKKMTALIDDLLAFSKIGKKEVQKSRVDMDSLVENTMREVKAAYQHSAEIKKSDLPSASADHSLLAQVWMNLLSNAMKYSAKKEKAVIEIGSDVKEDEIIYFVRDNGAGFNMAYADKLFGVFQRLHRSVDFEGTGVGLAIVQRIVAKHGGRVWAEGKVDEGAVFYFTLPNDDVVRK
jgi:two-component system sensor histidine kinase/response regulator